MTVGGTSILKYFRSVGSSSSLTTQTLPDQEGPLSEKFPAKAIKLPNAEVKWSEEPSCGQRTPYLILTPSQHYEVGIDKHWNIAYLLNCFNSHRQLEPVCCMFMK